MKDLDGQLSAPQRDHPGEIAQSGGAVFVLPMSGVLERGPIAPLITTMGLARAAQPRLRWAELVTLDGPIALDHEVPSIGHNFPARGDRSRLRRWIPETAITAAKDIRNVVRARLDRQAVADLRERPAFVWQRHVLNQEAGFDLAERYGVPLVLSVHACLIQEAEGWGIRRPGWGRALEKLGETRLFKRADVLSCVSNEVAQQVIAQGVASRRVVVTPNGVDADEFAPRNDAAQRRAQMGLDGRFVVGWVGSFRRLHDLNVLIKAFDEVAANVPEAHLLLVGDGPQLPAVREALSAYGPNAVTFTGSVAHGAVPELLSAMNAAVVTGQEPFHYSPVKLREYLAAGLPVVAPDVSDVRELFNGENMMLYVPGAASELASRLVEIAENPNLAATLGKAGREVAVARCTWDSVLDRILAHLAPDETA